MQYFINTKSSQSLELKFVFVCWSKSLIYSLTSRNIWIIFLACPRQTASILGSLGWWKQSCSLFVVYSVLTINILPKDLSLITLKNKPQFAGIIKFKMFASFWRNGVLNEGCKQKTEGMKWTHYEREQKDYFLKNVFYYFTQP